MDQLLFQDSRQRLALLVDDDEDIREMIRVLLMSQGYAVAAAKTVNEAERFLEFSEPSVIVLDYLVPNAESGKELAALARKRLPNAAKILMTCVPEARVLADQLGIEHLLQKPFDPEEFVGLIREAISDKFPD